jgi:hypothetical protein
VRYAASPRRKAKRKAWGKANQPRRRKLAKARYADDAEYRERRKRYTRTWTADNPERRREINAKDRAKPKNRVKARKVSNAWHADHRDEANGRRIVRKQVERNRDPWKGPVDAAVRRAKERGLPCDITHEWARARWTGNCELTGLPFVVGSVGNGPRMFSASVDQITAGKGYTQGNCRFILWCVNAFKHTGTDADIFTVAEALLSRRAAVAQAELRELSRRYRSRRMVITEPRPSPTAPPYV